MKCIKTQCQCSGMRFDVFQTSDKYKSVGGRPVHWPTTKNYLIRVSSLNRRHLIGKNAFWVFIFLNHVFLHKVT